jgi:hypothetical protein
MPEHVAGKLLQTVAPGDELRVHGLKANEEDDETFDEAKTMRSPWAHFTN